MSLLDITGLTHTFGDNLLFRDASFSLYKGEHAGIVGQNGAGKSTLIKICTGQTIPDAGSVAWQPKIKIGYLDQYAQAVQDVTMETFLKSAYAKLYEMEKNMDRLYAQGAAGDMSALEQAAKLQEQLQAQEFYMIDTRVGQVTSGLGLRAIGLDRPLAQMSGGQRAKVILAKLLLEDPDVLLLDEPTNFLDKEHVAWLADYLTSLKGAYMVVSHDNAFLDQICTRILDIGNLKIKKYHGSYSDYLNKKAAFEEDYTRQYAAQQKEIKQTEEFIRKNIAGRKTKMAQGRRKQLARMDKLEALDEKAHKPVFPFTALPCTAAEHLRVSRLSVGYYYPLLSGMDFTVKGGEKIVMTGFNGIGKSTLLKTLIGQIPPLQGTFQFADQVTPGYFAQELVWENQTLTPVEIVCAAYPARSAKEVRQHLARCGISSKHALQAIGTLSGGEQAKVKLCLLTLTPCNFLILDEPTNHLDAQAKTALREALCAFSGTVLLVSHEEMFYRDWVDRIIPVG